MALKSQSLFLYGFQITASNQNLDFKTSSGGSQLTAVIPYGFYSLTDLMAAIVIAMQTVDTMNIYTVTADRTQSSGTQNRVTIATSGAYLSLLFSSGTHAISSIASLIGFSATDQTGATSYTGTSSAGTALITQLPGYNYTGPNRNQLVVGAVNVSASGIKESLVFQIQQFITVTFMWEPEAIIDSTWMPLLQWMIQQRPFDYTPEITNPTVFYSVTLETSPQSGTGLEYLMEEMIDKVPFEYQLGPIKMRIENT